MMAQRPQMRIDGDTACAKAETDDEDHGSGADGARAVRHLPQHPSASAIRSEATGAGVALSIDLCTLAGLPLHGEPLPR